jgi:dTDP-4-dehydrorhamnose reductase
VSVDILLTGADGQLGWEVARQISQPLTIQAMNRAELDVTNRDQVFETVAGVAPKVVVNAAAYTAVDKAEGEESKAFSVNRDGPAYLAEACSSHNASLIHVSTDYVFDGRKTEPYTEDDPTNPLSVYGKSKLAGELAVRAACDRHVILRTAWVHGVRGNNFVKTMLRLGGEQSLLRVVDDQYGAPTFARDLASAVISVTRRMVDNSAPSEGLGTFHCTGGGATTWYKLAREIFNTAMSRDEVLPKIEAITTSQYPTPAPRPCNSVLDCGKLARVYGIVMRPWEEALSDMLNETLKADNSLRSA